MSHAAPSPLRKGIGLIRVSWEQDGTTSPDIQRTAIESHAEHEGIRIIDWVVCADDHKYSGSRDDSEWWAILDSQIERIESHEADSLVVWQFSRIARNRLRWAMANDRVDKAGGSLESAHEKHEDTPSGRLMRGMHGEINAYYAEQIGETWKETLQRRVRDGLPGTGRPRFGYEYVRQRDANGRFVDSGQFVVDPETGPVLAEMYHRYVNLNHGFGRIAVWLNRSGIPTPRDTSWDGTKVRVVLESGFGAGKLATNVRNNRGQFRTPTYNAGRQTPVIDEDTWSRFLSRRASAPQVARLVMPVSALSGVLKCGDCRGNMVAYIRYSNKARERAWRCVSAAQIGDGRRNLSISDSKAMRLLKEWVSDLASDVDALAQAELHAQRRKVAVIDDAAAIDRQLEKLKSDLGKLTVRLVQEKITDSAYAAASELLQAQIDSLTERHRNAAEVTGTSINVRELTASILDVWDNATPLELNTLIRQLVRRVMVVPDPIHFRGRPNHTLDPIPSWDD
ncbi:recombinase family protein [Gryllotalpicola koreensis]|uniref:recombinase family protein n=1 Tax=Gryllotalpicola koreensis TaxID=993086 RepID=UPI0031DA4563